jgi:hypothetical protein
MSEAVWVRKRKRKSRGRGSQGVEGTPTVRGHQTRIE